MRHWIGHSLRGFCMGLADVVPGVSGGTVAFILGIYARLVDAVGNVGWSMVTRLRRRSFLSLLGKGLREPAALPQDPEGADAGRVLLLASVVAGIAMAILLAVRPLSLLMSAHPAEMNGLFLGLVAAAVIVPLREIERRSVSRWVLAGASALATVWFLGVSASTRGHASGVVTLEFGAPLEAELVITPTNLTLAAPGEGGRPGVAFGARSARTFPAGSAAAQVEILARRAGEAGNAPAGTLRVEESPAPVASVAQSDALAGGRDPSPWIVFLGGALAVSAMSLPGLSGAFVLVLLGLYEYVAGSLDSLLYHGDLSQAFVVVPMVAGMAVGILTFARVLDRLFSKWRDQTLAAVVGLMIGSLLKLWPFVAHSPDGGEVPIWPGADASPEIVAVALACASGASAVLALDWMGRRRARR